LPEFVEGNAGFDRLSHRDKLSLSRVMRASAGSATETSPACKKQQFQLWQNGFFPD
jgi:hypothetical protein